MMHFSDIEIARCWPKKKNITGYGVQPQCANMCATLPNGMFWIRHPFSVQVGVGEWKSGCIYTKLEPAHQLLHQCININPKLCTSVSMRNLMSNFTGKSKMFMLHFTFCFWLHRCAAASMAEWSTDWFPFHQWQAALLRERTPDNRLRVHGCRGRHLWTLQWWG